MSVLVSSKPVVTPAGTRRRPRGQQLRGPVARPQGAALPGGRPVQPVVPSSGRPVVLRRRPVVRPQSSQVQLTERGLALVLGLFAVLAACAVFVVVSRFLAVSNAPLDEGHPAPVSAAAQLEGSAIQR